MTIRTRLAFLSAVAAAALIPAAGASAEEINALVWCDHTDPAFLEPFTAETGITVNVKEYEGTGAGLALVEQSQPGDWDVFVVDSTDVKRVAERGLLAELDPADFPLSDIPDAVQAPELHQVDGTWRAVPEKFGYNAIAYDKDKVDEAAMRKAANLFDPAMRGQIAIYDYYLPLMTQMAILLGKDPKSITAEDLPEIRDKLFALKDNAVLVSDVVTSQTALATGEVGVLVGGGEYAVSGLHAEKP
ncbi:MAG TPA: extracellular solute-binding protein, partial [Methylomirabilota bacterium]|nr:extracellular solute-binding protein [Methylomirabilota bacterium]